ncbi:hypothetical protein ACFELO_03335 [Oceanicaulis sp. LC35]|uniref:hypothetical protein n=1 Tax=Oceanicaulis sp. LC35 TaxID=3349635 RepID=UPI003F843299
MADTSEHTKSQKPESLDREAQRRREAGADGAEADKVPRPGPSKYKDAKTSDD